MKAFILGILVVSIIFSVNPFLKKQIMTEVTSEQILSIVCLVSLLTNLIKSYLKGKNILDFSKTSNKTIIILIVSVLLSLVYSVILNNLLKDYDIKDVMPYVRCGEMIWIFLISIFFNNDKFNLKKLLGIILVTVGIYLGK